MTNRKLTNASTGPLIIGDELMQRRLERWGQTPATRLAGAHDAPAMIDRLGMTTLFPASPQIPNLFQAYQGDPSAAVDSAHDSPSGEVYGWRWPLGRSEAAFYATVVRNRPTWVSWSLTPAILRLRGEMRTADQLYRSGEISSGARRIAEALERAGGVLSTGELRRQARFPTGKPNRAAYLKAMDELDRRLLVAKVFAADSTDMSHALVQTRYPEMTVAAERLSRTDALEQILDVYLPHAVYVVPPTLARHLGLPEAELRSALEGFVAAGRLAPAQLDGTRGTCYVWQAPEMVS
jgi:hypothetical protein